MAPKIFLTGITGYMGGSVFAQLLKHHPEYEITAYVRKTPEGFASRFPNVKLVHGTWDDSDTLRKAAAENDVTIGCGDSDQVGAVTAMLDGVRSRGEGKGYYIHLGGTGITNDASDSDGKKHRGVFNDHTYDDLENIEEVLNRPDGSLHRETDKLIQQAGAEGVRTAIMCPPDMYGKGAGPVKVTSVYVPTFIAEAKKLGAAFYYGEGTNVRGWSYTHDIAHLFVRLVEEALKGGGTATWGREGYYFATAQETSQKEMATRIGKILHQRGVLQQAEPKSIDEAAMDKLLEDWGQKGLGWYLFGNNSRATAKKAHKELGWQPSNRTLWDYLESDIDLSLNA